MSQLAERYARAAWQAAATEEAQETLGRDFATFCGAFKVSDTLRQALSNPAFKNQRAQVLNAVLRKADAQATATRLLQLLVENERLGLLGPVHEALRALHDAAHNRLRAQVKSAVALSSAQLARIEEVLQKRMGKPVALDVTIDPALVAGMICKVGKLTFDSSLRKQLAQFAERAGAPAA